MLVASSLSLLANLVSGGGVRHGVLPSRQGEFKTIAPRALGCLYNFVGSGNAAAAILCSFAVCVRAFV